MTEYLFRHVIQRSASDLHQYQYGYGFYFKVLWEFAWPWILVVPFAVIAEARSQGSKVLFVQALLPLLIFSLATTKFQWYVLPAIPALAVLIGLFVRSVFDFVGPRARRLGWLTVTLLAIVGGLVTLTHCKPDPGIQAVAQLARIAAKDPGAISSCPESLEMTVLYYSDRKLCVDPVVSPLSFGGLSNCGEVEIRHFIFQNDKRPLIESRFGSIRVLNETGNVSYGEVK